MGASVIIFRITINIRTNLLLLGRGCMFGNCPTFTGIIIRRKVLR
jgi:hypothetical protein